MAGGPASAGWCNQEPPNKQRVMMVETLNKVTQRPLVAEITSIWILYVKQLFLRQMHCAPHTPKLIAQLN